jgi:hypothetical protein
VKALSVVIITLMLAVAVSYTVIIVDEHLILEYHGHDHIEETILFGAAIPMYVGFAYWITKTNRTTPIIITMFGNAALVIIYLIAESSLSESILGVETEELSDFGITIKIFQLAIIAISIIKLKTHNN